LFDLCTKTESESPKLGPPRQHTNTISTYITTGDEAQELDVPNILDLEHVCFGTTSERGINDAIGWNKSEPMSISRNREMTVSFAAHMQPFVATHTANTTECQPGARPEGSCEQQNIKYLLSLKGLSKLFGSPPAYIYICSYSTIYMFIYIYVRTHIRNRYTFTLVLSPPPLSQQLG
jgi:hypothetical protein